MTNRELSRLIKAFLATRRDWVEILNANPYDSGAAQHIISCNSKLELLSTMWDWTDESLDFPDMRG